MQDFAAGYPHFLGVASFTSSGEIADPETLYLGALSLMRSYSAEGPHVADPEVLYLGALGLLWAYGSQAPVRTLHWGGIGLTSLWEQPHIAFGGSALAHVYQPIDARLWLVMCATEVAFGGRLTQAPVTWDCGGAGICHWRSVESWDLQGAASCWWGGMWFVGGGTDVHWTPAAAPVIAGFRMDGATEVIWLGAGGVPGTCISGDGDLDRAVAGGVRNYAF